MSCFNACVSHGAPGRLHFGQEVRPGCVSKSSSFRITAKLEKLETKTGIESTGNRVKEVMLYNTMSRQKEVFKPKVPGKVSMYVCGVTAYDFSHIGHARVYVSFDMLYRYLRYVGYEVTYVRNFTDIDDKIIRRANELGEDPIHLSARFCNEFHKDMTSLRCLAPTVEPRVSGNVDRIIEMISQILENGYGYVIENGDVYFSLDKFVPDFSDYGRLSGRKLDDNRAGERVAVDDRKLNPGDFVLWKSSKPGEPSWNSPWGPGRPGWHIECSAMSAATLGMSFDIHGGGMDLIFPHHENEIAQSRAACTDSHVGYWIHNGFVTVDSEKMSKSLGNFFTIREVLEQYHPLALRWFLLATHYRSPINFSKAPLESASDRVYYLYQVRFVSSFLRFLLDRTQTLSDTKTLMEEQADLKKLKASKQAVECAASFKSAFASALADDLNTPSAILAFSEPLKVMNDLLHTKAGRKDINRCTSLQLLHLEIEHAVGVIGFSVESYSKVLEELRSKALKRAGMTETELLSEIQQRTDARAAKDYARSDEIRRRLSALGIALMDGGDGTLWRPSAITEL